MHAIAISALAAMSLTVSAPVPAAPPDTSVSDFKQPVKRLAELPTKRPVSLSQTPSSEGSFGSCDLSYIKSKESGGNYQATNGQYTGAYQQSTNSWQTYGDGSAPTAGQASPASQDQAAAKQYAAEGSRPWSVCQ